MALIGFPLPYSNIYHQPRLTIIKEIQYDKM